MYNRKNSSASLSEVQVFLLTQTDALHRPETEEGVAVAAKALAAKHSSVFAIDYLSC
jgi:hypothetical protein